MPWFIVVVGGLFVLFDLVWWWCADRAARTLPHARWWRVGTAAFAGLMLLYVALLFGGAFVGGYTLPRPVMALGFLWHLFGLPLFLLIYPPAAVADFVRRKLAERRARDADVEVVDLSRRRLLSSIAAATPPVVAVASTGVALHQFAGFRIREMPIDLPGLPSALDGLTIAHVADTHVGDFTRGRVLERIATAVTDLDVDLVAVTGDLINREHGDIPAAAEMINAMKARHGVFVCEGNHDLFEGRRSFVEGLRTFGIDPLIDDIRPVTVNGHDVDVLGVSWGPVRRVTDDVVDDLVTDLAARRRASAFPVLLAHHPHAFDPAAAAGIPLTLAGHTHGGQLHLTHHVGFGPLMYRYWSGLYRKSGGQAAVISNGTGNWFPLRVGAPAEIIRITLRRR